MSDKTYLILNAIKEEKTFREIEKNLNISPKELFFHLKKIVCDGYEFDKTYFFNGDILYLIKSNLKETFNDRIIISNDLTKDTFRMLFVSDFHIGSSTDRMDLVSEVYSYAINNKINYIANTGDLIENNYTDRPLKLKTVKEQINSVINEHPCDKRITNLVLYGNHDLYSLTNENIDVGKIIEAERPDIVNLGYGRCFVGLKNDYITLSHNKVSCLASTLHDIPKIKFSGGSHKYKVFFKDITEIYVPALCDTVPSNYSYKPFKGFLDVSFLFNENNLIRKVDIKNFVIYNGLHLADEVSILVRKK